MPMKSLGSPGFLIVIGVLVAAAGLGLAQQWRQTLLLRGEVELARSDVVELAQLQAENERLRARQVSVAELEQLRADHAALPRLRAELEAAKRRIAAPR
jgi:Tfp pilus assembly protein PilN